MEKTTEFLELNRLDKEQALRAFAKGAELSLFVQQDSGKFKVRDYQPTNKNGVNQGIRIFAVPDDVGNVEYVATDKVLRL